MFRRRGDDGDDDGDKDRLKSNGGKNIGLQDGGVDKTDDGGGGSGGGERIKRERNGRQFIGKVVGYC